MKTALPHPAGLSMQRLMVWSIGDYDGCPLDKRAGGLKGKRQTMIVEPKPGEWLSPSDFATVIRLTPLVSIDLIVRSPEGRVLMGRRKHEPAKGTYFVTGGRITKNESRAAAFRRIAREELGTEARLDQARFVGVYDHFYSANRLEQAGYGTHYVSIAYELTLQQSPTALPLEQHGEYVWLTVGELLAHPEVHENTKAFFR
jgi:colanic acid biosynthesis protein WcaH